MCLPLEEEEECEIFIAIDWWRFVLLCLAVRIFILRLLLLLHNLPLLLLLFLEKKIFGQESSIMHHNGPATAIIKLGRFKHSLCESRLVVGRPR